MDTGHAAVQYPYQLPDKGQRQTMNAPDPKTKINYPHRRNGDGSYDAICMTCFATVDSQPIEADLAPAEQAHVCDNTLLSMRARPNKTHTS